MPFRKLEMKESRMQFVVRAASGAESLSELCREFGISRPTGRKWRDRYLACGTLAQLGELSRRPHSSPRRSAPERERQVLELRQRYGWGARKLQRLLEESGVRYPATTVHRILKRHGLVNVHAPRPALQRFERPRPNQLWQMDGKGPLKSLDGICQPLSILDDHSRYAVGLHALRVLRREPIQACLQQTFEQAGLPKAMLMDRGTQWFSAHSEHGLTVLSVWLIKQGIRLLYGRPRHPQTQGKVERFHGAIEAAVRHRGGPAPVKDWTEWLAHFRREYNEVRPHEALQMETPASRWRRSERAYQPQPPAWEYAAGMEVQRLNEAGCLWEGGRHWFVSEALAGEWVGLERLPLDTIAVRFRHMYVRELELGAQATHSLVRPAGSGGGGVDLGRPTGSRGGASTANPKPNRPSPPPSPGTEGGNDVL